MKIARLDPTVTSLATLTIVVPSARSVEGRWLVPQHVPSALLAATATARETVFSVPQARIASLLEPRAFPRASPAKRTLIRTMVQASVFRNAHRVSMQ